MSVQYNLKSVYSHESISFNIIVLLNYVGHFILLIIHSNKIPAINYVFVAFILFQNGKL